MAKFAQPTAPMSYREELAGCYNGVATFKSVYYCDPAKGAVDGDGTNTDKVSFFYQIKADGSKKILDYATAAASWQPGACAESAPFAVGVITNPEDPGAEDKPVALVVQPDGNIKYISLEDGADVTPAANEAFRVNADGYDLERIPGCIKDAGGATIKPGVELVVVTDEDAKEVSRVVMNSSTGAIITLGTDETFGPCSGGLASDIKCGCLVDETNNTVRSATQELPRNPDTGLVDWGAVKYSDPAGQALTKLATEAFVCGNCPKVIDCA